MDGGATTTPPWAEFPHRGAIVLGSGKLAAGIAEELLQTGKRNVALVSTDACGASGVKPISWNGGVGQSLVQSLVEAKQALGGHFSILVVAAGTAAECGLANIAPFQATIESTLQVAVEAAAFAAPEMVPQQSGAIVFVSSISAKQSIDSPGHLAWAAAHSAYAGVFEQTFNELRQSGVRVSIVYSGQVDNAMHVEVQKAMGAAFNPKVTADRWLSPSDVGRAVIFAASEGRVAVFNEVTIQQVPLVDRSDVFTEEKKVNERVQTLPEAYEARDVAFITGGGKGIGRGIALSLAKRGYHVALVARTQADLESVSAECLAAGSPGTSLHAVDVADHDALADAVRQVAKKWGNISVVISNAGINKRRPVALWTDFKQVENTMSIDLLAPMNLARCSIPYLIRDALQRPQVPGKAAPAFIFINTNYSHPKAVSRMPGISPYITSKTGLAAFQRVLTDEVRNWGVKVSTIFPGLVATGLGLKENKAGKLLDAERLVQAADCAAAVEYILDSSPTCLPTDIVVDSVQHAYPAVRKGQAKFLQAGLASKL